MLSGREFQRFTLCSVKIFLIIYIANSCFHILRLILVPSEWKPLRCTYPVSKNFEMTIIFHFFVQIIDINCEQLAASTDLWALVKISQPQIDLFNPALCFPSVNQFLVNASRLPCPLILFNNILLVSYQKPSQSLNTMYQLVYSDLLC